MRRSIVVLLAAVVLLTATAARASSFTFNSITNVYTYIGDPFNFCGYGCPAHAPSDPRGNDYIIATLLFGGPLAPNLTNATPVPLSWSMTDHFGAFNLTGSGVPNGIPPEDGGAGAPGLILSTNGSGNIVSWIMSANQGFVNGEGDFVGTLAIILNPPLLCFDECDGGGISDFVAVNVRSNPDTEWDAGTVVTPEPATLTLTALGLLGMGVRSRRRKK